MPRPINYPKVEGKGEEMMQQCKMSWIETQFLKKAVDILCECRRTLSCTYVFAYFIDKNNQKQIFEDNQSDLETATETLSEYLERDMTEDHQEDLLEMKQKVIDKSRYCDKRRKALLAHFNEGTDRDFWDYIDPEL